MMRIYIYVPFPRPRVRDLFSYSYVRTVRSADGNSTRPLVNRAVKEPDRRRARGGRWSRRHTGLPRKVCWVTFAVASAGRYLLLAWAKADPALFGPPTALPRCCFPPLTAPRDGVATERMCSGVTSGARVKVYWFVRRQSRRRYTRERTELITFLSSRLVTSCLDGHATNAGDDKCVQCACFRFACY